MKFYLLYKIHKLKEAAMGRKKGITKEVKIGH